jgi:histidine triad (HIT) family protein
MVMPDCPFCDKLADYAGWVAAFEPLNPVVPGHMLIVPKRHVEDFAEDPAETGRVMRYAARYVKDGGVGHCNLITSRGVDATQTVFHLHIHVIPRWPGDGLLLPWSETRSDA